VNLEIVSGSPTEDELAAIISAVEVALRLAAADGGKQFSRWRTAEREFVTELAEPRGWRASPRF
jgi:hypothetical protein